MPDHGANGRALTVSTSRAHRPGQGCPGYSERPVAQSAADPAALFVHDDGQQPSAHRLRCLLASAFPGRPTRRKALLDMFSHAVRHNGRDIYWPVAVGQK